MNLYYLNYNNYYNRIIKVEKSLEDYLQYENDRQIGANFSFNDNISTRIIVNSNNVGNYVILTDDTNEIISRWWILESFYERNGQHFITIRRDVIADNLAPILNAPMFIEKATLDSSDPMIFNSEDMTFNQIKTSETLLKDETGCGWVVGYVATNESGGNPYTYNTEFTPFIPVDYVANTKESFLNTLGIPSGYFRGPFNQDTNKNFFGVKTNDGVIHGFNKKYSDIIKYRSETTNSPITNEEWSYFKINTLGNPTQKETLCNELETALKQVLGFKTQQEINKLYRYNGKVVKTNDDKLYRIQISLDIPKNPTLLSIQDDSIPAAFETLIEYFPSANNESFYVNYEYVTAQMHLSEITNQKRFINISADRYHLSQAPYDMFCIPYSDDLIIKKNGTKILTASKQLAIDSAMALSRAYADAGALYDIQLLPYCPVRYCIQEDGSFDIKENKVSYITDENNTNVGIILFANDDTFTFNISLEDPIEINDYKMQSSTDMYRLCSPNYDGVFEFNAAKNYGISFFNVDATYKPYNPYIHMNPNFNGLYGQDFNDSRGLIIGGDFSLPQATSAWESYQLTTKNYQASFNRQITNMEINNSTQKILDSVDAVMGTLQASAMGAEMGANIGGGRGVGASLGAAAGAATAGATAGVLGAIDVAANELIRNEALNYTKDQFGYSLGNIQALPTSLSKTSAFVANNKIFPFLEYYTCTEEEKEALRNKIKYNGMTVMRIGTIQEFRKPEPTYIKGKLIRLELNEDNHIINEIANELNKGVYI